MIAKTSQVASNSEDLLINVGLDRAKAFILESKKARVSYISDPLRRTQQGWINPSPSMKAKLKQARQLVKTKTKHNNKLEELRETIIQNLTVE